MRPLRTLAVALAAVLVLLGACGNDTAMPENVSAELSQQIDRIEQLATAGDYVGARAGASELRTRVDDLHGRGLLDDAAARRVTDAVATVESELDRSITATAPVPTTTTSTTTTARIAPRSTTTKVVTTTVAPNPGNEKGKGKQKKDDDRDD